MSSRNELNPWLRMVGPDRIRFVPDSDWAGIMKWAFIVVGGAILFVDLLASLFHQGYWKVIFTGDDRYFHIGLHLLPVGLLALWLTSKRVKIHFERESLKIRFQSKKHDLEFSWSQVAWKYHSIRVPHSTLKWILLYVIPPLPEEVQREIDRARRPSLENVQGLLIGSIGVENPEHGEAIFAFLDAWMRSREPAAPLYDAMVRSRFGG